MMIPSLFTEQRTLITFLADSSTLLLFHKNLADNALTNAKHSGGLRSHQLRFSNVDGIGVWCNQKCI